MNKKLAVIAAVGAISAISMFAVACGGGNDNNGDKSYTITLDANGGMLAGSATVITGSDGKIAEADFPADPTHATDAFAGWFTSVAGGDRVDTSYVFTADDTVYAHWTSSAPEGELESDIVTAQEWLDAWEFDGVDDVWVRGNFVGMGIVEYKWAVDKFEFRSVYEGQYSDGNEQYFEEYGDTRDYVYSYDEQAHEWTKRKTPYRERVDESLGGLDSDIAPYFDEFDYNATLKAYVGTYVSDEHGQMTVTVKIKDGVLRYFKCEGDDMDVMDCTVVEFTLDYGNTVVALPKAKEIKHLTLSSGVSNATDSIEELCDEFETAYSNENVRLTINVVSGLDETSDVVYASCSVLQPNNEQSDIGYAALSAEKAQAVKSECTNAAVQTVAYGDKIYGFPVDMSNTFFMWYDPEFFSATDVLSLNAMAQKAAAQNKFIAFPYDNMWYASAFFYGTGCSFGYDDNGDYTADISGNKGKNAAQAMLDLFGTQAPTHDVFYIPNGLAGEDTVAYFGGVWSKASVPNNFVAAVCPKFTANGSECTLTPPVYSMCFAVGNKCEELEIAEELAAYLSSAAAQTHYLDADFIAIPANNAALADVRDQITADAANNAALTQIEHAVAVQGRQSNEFWVNGMNFVKGIYDGDITAANVENKLNELSQMLNY